MPFKIVRNDITKMQVDAIVNTANEHVAIGDGVDTAVYEAAGKDLLLAARKEIGYMKEGQVAITPGFHLAAKYIIHAVSPLYIDGEHGEADKLRDCYSKSLQLALESNCESIAFPLISTGSYGYPKEEAMRIAVDEIHTFLMKHQMLIYLVVFDNVSANLGLNIYPDLEAYIDYNYVCQKREQEYGDRYYGTSNQDEAVYASECAPSMAIDLDEFLEKKDSALEKRMQHLSDTFQEYLFYIIEEKGLTNADVYKRAILTKQLFSKIKNNPAYQPNKSTAMRLCVGAKLNLDETKDLLARAGFALSPCDKSDIIFSYFIENQVYDMIEIDIALEEHGLSHFIE